METEGLSAPSYRAHKHRQEDAEHNTEKERHCFRQLNL